MIEQTCLPMPQRGALSRRISQSREMIKVATITTQDPRDLQTSHWDVVLDRQVIDT